MLPAWTGPTPLPAPEKMWIGVRLRLLVEILTLYLPSLLAMRRRQPITEHLVAARSPRGPRLVVPAAQRREVAVRLGGIVTQVLDRLPTDSRCLIRSVVLVRLLARRSIDARLVIGVTVDGGFCAHAWVEYEDQPLLPVGAHTPLTRL
jgi:hypothetical protein